MITASCVVLSGTMKDSVLWLFGRMKSGYVDGPHRAENDKGLLALRNNGARIGGQPRPSGIPNTLFAYV